MWDAQKAYQTATDVQNRLTEECLRVVEDEIATAAHNGLFDCNVSVGRDWMLVMGRVCDQLEEQGFVVHYDSITSERLNVRWIRRQ